MSNKRPRYVRDFTEAELEEFILGILQQYTDQHWQRTLEQGVFEGATFLISKAMTAHVSLEHQRLEQSAKQNTEGSENPGIVPTDPTAGGEG